MLTGEPYARDPHVRFGGRGGANQCAVPTPIVVGARELGVAALDAQFPGQYASSDEYY